MIKRTAAPDIRPGRLYIYSNLCVFCFAAVQQPLPALKMRQDTAVPQLPEGKLSCAVFHSTTVGLSRPPSLSIPLLLLRELFSICLAGVDPGGIGCLVEDKALAAEDDRSGCRSIILPCAHPLAVSPPVRAEEGCLFASQRGFNALIEGLEFAVLKCFGSHCGAAQGDQIGIAYIGGRSRTYLKQLYLCAGLLNFLFS